MLENKGLLIIAVLATIIIGLLLLFIILKRKENPKDLVASLNSKTKGAPIDMNKLLKAIGEKENVIEVNSTMSKITFVLNNYKIVDIALLKEVGASGIVENNKGLNVIFGKTSPVIAESLTSLIETGEGNA